MSDESDQLSVSCECWRFSRRKIIFSWGEIPPGHSRYCCVNGFIDNGAKIFEAAQNVMNSGESPSDYTIVMGAEGGITMLADSDWPLDSLLREYGAGMAYRIKPGQGGVSVDGADGNSSCHFETMSAREKARFVLNSFPISYTLIQPQLTAA